MKRITVSIIILCTILACNRNELTPAGTLNNSNKNKIYKYLNKLKTSAHADSLKDMVQNGQLYIENLANRAVYTIDIADNGTVKEKNKLGRLVFFTYADSIISTQVIYLGSDQYSKSTLQENFANMVNGKFRNFTGTIYTNRLSFSRVSITEYKDGLTVRRQNVLKTSAPATASATNKTSEMQCWNWYWVWYDQWGHETSRDFLYTYCEGSDGGGWPDQEDHEIDPNSGGGGTGGEQQCPPVTPLDQGNTASEDAGTDVVDINGLTKEKNPNWRCHKGATWAILSYEKGIVQRDDDGGWIWVSLSHSRLQFVGTSWGGGVSPNEGSATPSFTSGTPNVRYAGISLSYSLTFTPAYACPGITIFIPPHTTPYNATSTFWNAIP